MINKVKLKETANLLINKNLNVFMFNCLSSRKEYEMNKFLYDQLKGRLIDELKASSNYISFKNQKQQKRVFDYSATLKEIEFNRLDITSFKNAEPKLYKRIQTQYNLNGVQNRIDYVIKRVK